MTRSRRSHADVYFDLKQSARERQGVPLLPPVWAEKLPIIDRLVQAGTLGKKSGKGLYEVSGLRWMATMDGTVY